MNMVKHFIRNHDDVPKKIKENPPDWLVNLVDDAYDEGHYDSSLETDEKDW